MVAPGIKQKAEKIRLLLTDCDGCLTDGGVFYSARGEEMKCFNIRDGMGVKRLQFHAGVETGIVTGELSGSVKKRAEKLGIEELHLGARDKGAVFDAITSRRDIPPEAVAYLGDDVNDLEPLKRAGLSACPADAVSEVKEVVDVVLTLRGGQGCFREFAELILAAFGLPERDSGV